MGGADGRPGGPRSEDRRWRGFQPSTGAAALNAGFIPDAEAPTLAIIPEPALAVRPGLQVLTGAQIPPESAPAVRPLIHDEAHAPLSALPQSSPVRWGNVPDCLRTLPQPGPLGGGWLCSGVGAARWVRQVSKTEEIEASVAWVCPRNYAVGWCFWCDFGVFSVSRCMMPGLISSVLDTAGPTTPDNRPHQHAAPPKTTNPRERHLETHE